MKSSILSNQFNNSLTNGLIIKFSKIKNVMKLKLTQKDSLKSENLKKILLFKRCASDFNCSTLKPKNFIISYNFSWSFNIQISKRFNGCCCNINLNS